MIRQFGLDTALLLIDVQQGVDVLQHWGGASGRRNNPGAEDAMRQLLGAWRSYEFPVLYTQHDSREAASPLKLSGPGGRWKDAVVSNSVLCKHSVLATASPAKHAALLYGPPISVGGSPATNCLHYSGAYGILTVLARRS
ncbi:MAG: hypothetical protein AAF441_24635 [Pseudomonadota bacterium]